MLLALAVVLVAPRATAGLMCAQPLVAHEWGVHVYATDGAPVASPVALPGWFHRSALIPSSGAVRDLPADNGVRFLPVLHFYAAGASSAPIPVGVEVGFGAGPASVWFPQVDRLRSAAEANGAAAAAAREALLTARAARGPMAQHPPLPADPTRQLIWDRLELTAGPRIAPADSDVPWVASARKLDALWVNHGPESERFVFYEAGTAEPLPLALKRDRSWAPGHRAYALENRGAHPVHDVFLTHEEAGTTYVFTASTVAAGGAVRFVLEEHAVKDRRAATRGRLRAALTGAHGGADVLPANPGCVMGRDPAIPVEEPAGHRLFAGEVDLILAIWGERFFDRPGTTLVWREDAATLSAATPLSLYTDMFHYVVLQRAGLALWEHVRLP